MLYTFIAKYPREMWGKKLCIKQEITLHTVIRDVIQAGILTGGTQTLNGVVSLFAMITELIWTGHTIISKTVDAHSLSHFLCSETRRTDTLWEELLEVQWEQWWQQRSTLQREGDSGYYSTFLSDLYMKYQATSVLVDDEIP